MIRRDVPWRRKAKSIVVRGCGGTTFHCPPHPLPNGNLCSAMRVQLRRPGSVQAAMVCASLKEKRPRIEIKVIQGVWGSGVPHSPTIGGTIGGKRKSGESHLQWSNHSRKPQSAGCAYDRKQSFLTPNKTNNPLPAFLTSVSTLLINNGLLSRKGHGVAVPRRNLTALNPKTNNRSNLSPHPVH